MKPLSLLLAHIALILSYNAHAQVDTDGSMGAVKHLSGNMLIPQSLGTTSGHNLFHSFDGFNIDKNETVTFTGSNQLHNVISRVTGGSISKIDGLLKSEIGQANFYFINPAGIVFGTNASVDVPAAFHISTSDSLQFKDSQAFLASLTVNNSSLSISEPTDFGFLGDNAGDIKIERYYDNATENYVGNTLNFNYANNVLLDAKNITIDQGTLLNPSGAITLNAKENLNLNNNSLIDNSTNSSKNAGQLSLTANAITMDNTSIIQSNANQDSLGNAGIVTIKAQDIILKNGSYIDDSSYSYGNAGQLTATATNNIELNNAAFLVNASATTKDSDGIINIKAKNFNIDGGANNGGIYSSNYIATTPSIININADTITLKNTGAINSATNGKGNAGNISINSNALTINNANTNSHTNDLGNAGTITINSNRVTVDNNGYISSSTDGTGNAGAVLVQQAKELIIDHNASINSSTSYSATGNADLVTVNSDNIRLAHDGNINSITQGAGKGGNVVIQQAKELIIDGGTISNEIYSTGNGGNISVTADKLILNNNGRILSTAFDDSKGKAGNIAIQAKTVDIVGSLGTNNTRIAAEARNNSSGQTGNITVTASEAVRLNNYAQITIENSASIDNKISEKAANKESTGIVRVSAPEIVLNNNSEINAQSTGNIGAGQLAISFAHRLSVSNNSTITTNSITGNGGNVVINGGDLINLHNANINTYTNGKTDVKGGDITISSTVLLMNNAQILARGQSLTNGGYANLALKAIIASGNQLVVNGKTISDFESSQLATNIIRTAESGWNTPQLNISGSISALNRNILELPDLNKGSCDDVILLSSSLTRTSKGGISKNEMTSTFVPPADTVATQQIQTAITPLLAIHLTTTNTPCASLSL